MRETINSSEKIRGSVSRRELRSILECMFPIDSLLKAFICDLFPTTHRQIPNGMDSVAQITLLLCNESSEEIMAGLLRYHGKELAKCASRVLIDKNIVTEYENRQQKDIADIDILCRTAEILRRRKIQPTEIEKQIIEIRKELRRGPQLCEGIILGNQFELQKPLGSGGIAEVWLARNIQFGKKSDPLSRHAVVAVKILHSHHAREEKTRRRFLRGAAIMKQMRHNNIVKILYGPIEEDARIFFVMEFFPGGSLFNAIHRREIKDKEAIQSILAVGEALSYLHTRSYLDDSGITRIGLIHRDVTPHNILLDKQNNQRRTFLTDFDIVIPENTSTVDGLKGHAGGCYASPEQLRDYDDLDLLQKKLNPTIDVYGLGMTTLFALTQHELSRDDRHRVDDMINNLDYHVEVRVVLGRALHELPERRYKTIREYCSQLQEAWERQYSDVTVAAPLETMNVPRNIILAENAVSKPIALYSENIEDILDSVRKTDPVNINQHSEKQILLTNLLGRLNDLMHGFTDYIIRPFKETSFMLWIVFIIATTSLLLQFCKIRQFPDSNGVLDLSIINFSQKNLPPKTIDLAQDLASISDMMKSNIPIQNLDMKKDSVDLVERPISLPEPPILPKSISQESHLPTQKLGHPPTARDIDSELEKMDFNDCKLFGPHTIAVHFRIRATGRISTYDDTPGDAKEKCVADKIKNLKFSKFQGKEPVHKYRFE